VNGAILDINPAPQISSDSVLFQNSSFDPSTLMTRIYVSAFSPSIRSMVQEGLDQFSNWNNAGQRPSEVKKTGKGVVVNRVQTAQNTTDRLTEISPATFQPASPVSVTTIAVNTSARYQKMFGFGGAFTESSAYVLSTLNSTLQQQVMDMYFSDQGHRYNMGRTHINSCDYSLSFYNFDDVAGDVELINFSIEHDKKLLIPFILSAQNMVKERGENLWLVSTPWSAPGT
jgi:hypothetical protein